MTPFQIEFIPILPISILLILGALYFAIWAIIFWRDKRINYYHICASLLLFLAVLNPQRIIKTQTILPINIGIITDYSQSMLASKRTNGTRNFENNLISKLKEYSNLNIITENIPSVSQNSDFALAIDRVLKKSPEAQIGAVFIITDGLNQSAKNLKWQFPIYQMLVGEENETDYYVKLISRPKPTKIGENANIEFIVVNDKIKNGKIKTIIHIGQEIMQIDAKLNEITKLEIKVQNRKIIPIAIEAISDEAEVSKANNAIITQIEPAQDSLRVLLVTGEPYEGARAWRNLLKSDPAIDLVHFTLLRGPTKIDTAYESELALIPFPTEELFINKLNEFDLVIFDRFENLIGLRPIYMENIKQYVKNGGAFLASLGPRDTLGQGIMNTSIKDILPIEGIPNPIDEEFTPQITQTGKIHPITSTLNGQWGKWDRFFKTKAKGIVLLSNNENPILVIDKYEKGRVAVILSDKSWFWQRGYDGGGPFRELIGRTAYWLMGDEKLADTVLKLSSKNNSIFLEYDYISNPQDIFISGQGFSAQINNNDIQNHIAREFTGLDFGLYKAQTQDISAFAINGDHNETRETSLSAGGTSFENSLQNKNQAKTFFMGLNGQKPLPQIEISNNFMNIFQNNKIIIANKKVEATSKISMKPAIKPEILAGIIILLYFMAWGLAQKFRR